MIECEVDNICAAAQTNEFVRGRKQDPENREHGHRQRETEQRAIAGHVSILRRQDDGSMKP